jgi:hypothetical protein
MLVMCVCLLLQYLLQRCSSGGTAIVEDIVLRETTSRGLCGLVCPTAVMARRRRRRRPGGHTTAVGSGGRPPISTDTASHTHTARSLACPLLTLSSARPFSNGIFRSNGAPASLPPASSSLTHARRMDGFCNQNADQLGSDLAGSSLLTVYVGVVECAPASLPPASSSFTHARRMDGFCNQNADQLGSLAGPSLLTVYVGVVECAPASVVESEPFILFLLRKHFITEKKFKKKSGDVNDEANFSFFFLLHTRAKPLLPPYLLPHSARELKPALPPYLLLTVYVGVVECAPASPYTYSSSTQVSR